MRDHIVVSATYTATVPIEEFDYIDEPNDKRLAAVVAAEVRSDPHGWLSSADTFAVAVEVAREEATCPE